MPESGPYQRAALALALIAVDPGLGGLRLRARAGPVRDRLLARLDALPQPVLRLQAGAGPEALSGGTDVLASLAEGRLVQRAGLLSRAGTLILTTAERLELGMLAPCAAAMDGGAAPVILALDEGAGPDEAPGAALLDRLGLSVDLTEATWSEARGGTVEASRIAAARANLPGVHLPEGMLAEVAHATLAFGIASGRAGAFALRAARAHAALKGRAEVLAEDLDIAAQLVLAPRATCLPESAEDQPEDQGPPPPEGEGRTEGETLPQDLLIEAIRAAIPPGLLDGLRDGRAALRAKGSGAGARRKGNRRGTPLPARPGRPDAGQRIDLVASLRAAAPWQPLRRAEAARRGGTDEMPRLMMRAADLRIVRRDERSDRLVIFAVDASGSSALARLAEAKGAVEMLLAEAYARRDHVALVAFRGTGAEVLLPPTRSLVQTKRRLAALPGGGGTPLAAGIEAALRLALTARRRGMTPALALLTDGRANVALDGQGGRARAAEDASRMARLIRAEGLPALVIDTGARPDPATGSLARDLGGSFLALPRASSARLSQAVAAAFGD